MITLSRVRCARIDTRRRSSVTRRSSFKFEFNPSTPNQIANGPSRVINRASSIARAAPRRRVRARASRRVDRGARRARSRTFFVDISASRRRVRPRRAPHDDARARAAVAVRRRGERGVRAMRGSFARRCARARRAWTSSRARSTRSSARAERSTGASAAKISREALDAVRDAVQGAMELGERAVWDLQLGSASDAKETKAREALRELDAVGGGRGGESARAANDGETGEATGDRGRRSVFATRRGDGRGPRPRPRRGIVSRSRSWSVGFRSPKERGSGRRRTVTTSDARLERNVARRSCYRLIPRSHPWRRKPPRWVRTSAFNRSQSFCASASESQFA